MLAIHFNLNYPNSAQRNRPRIRRIILGFSRRLTGLIRVQGLQGDLRRWRRLGLLRLLCGAGSCGEKGQREKQSQREGNKFFRHFDHPFCVRSYFYCIPLTKKVHAVYCIFWLYTRREKLAAFSKSRQKTAPGVRKRTTRGGGLWVFRRGGRLRRR